MYSYPSAIVGDSVFFFETSALSALPSAVRILHLPTMQVAIALIDGLLSLILTSTTLI